MARYAEFRYAPLFAAIMLFAAYASAMPMMPLRRRHYFIPARLLMLPIAAFRYAATPLIFLRRRLDSTPRPHVTASPSFFLPPPCRRHLMPSRRLRRRYEPFRFERRSYFERC